MRKLPTIILFVASIVIARQPATVYGYSCEPAQLTSHSFTGQDSSYVITRRCTHTYSHGGNEVLNLTYFGTWKGATEVATEHVSNRVRYYKDGVQKNDQTYQYDVTAKCLQDPWLTGMDCYSHHVDYPYPECGGVATTPPNPKGASILPAALRQSLQQEYYELRAAPTILEPVNNATFGFPVAIPIRIQHNPDYNLRFKIEWRPDAQHALKQVSTNIITGEQTVNGIMTATVHPTEEGEWTIRAQLDTNASPWWSDPVTVTVKGSSSEAVVPVELETISLPVSGPLTAPEVLLPRVNHTYAAGETIPLQISFQKGTRLHYQLGVRAKGSSAFNMFPAVQSADNGSGFFDAKIPGYIGALVDGDVAELLVKAWVERPETSNPQQYLSNQSDISELVTAIIAPELIITAPQQAQKIPAPVQVHFTIPFNGHGIELSGAPGALVEKVFEVELQRADKVPGSAIAFAPCGNELTVRTFGDLLLFSYELTDPAIYRFRARYNMGAELGAGELLHGQWTDWRLIEIVSLQSQLKPVPIGDTLAVQPGGDGVSVKPMSPHGAKLIARSTPDTPADKSAPADLGKNLAREQLSVRDQVLVRTVPTILRPAQGQKLRAGATVPLVFQGLGEDGDVVWELEYRPFGQKNYTSVPANRLRLTGGHATLQTTGVIMTEKEGEYRVRIRLDDQRQPWGQWREFQVGIPSVIKTVQPVNRLEPVRAKTIQTPQTIEPAEAVGKTLPAPTQTRKPALKAGPPSQLKTIKTQ